MAKVTKTIRENVAKLFRDGMKKADIQRELTVSRHVVDRWCKVKGANFSDKHRPGRPSKFGAALRRKIRRQAKTLSITAAAITRRHNKLQCSPKTRITKMTVCRILKAGRKPRAWRRIESVRVLRAANKAARLAFCRMEKPTRDCPWVFADGKVFTMTKDRLGMLTRAWVRRGEKPPRKTNKRLLAHLHIYGAVAKGFKSRLIFVPPSGSGTTPKSKETFKASHYLGVLRSLKTDLEQRYPPGSQYRLIRDRASQHVKQASREAVTALGVSILESFPAQTGTSTASSTFGPSCSVV